MTTDTVLQSPYWKPKFYVTCFVLVSATILLACGMITSDNYVFLSNGALLTFVGGSVYENKALAGK